MFNDVKFNITVSGTWIDYIRLGGILLIALLGRKLAVTRNNGSFMSFCLFSFYSSFF